MIFVARVAAATHTLGIELSDSLRYMTENVLFIIENNMTEINKEAKTAGAANLLKQSSDKGKRKASTLATISPTVSRDSTPKKHKKNPAVGVPRTVAASVARKPSATSPSLNLGSRESNSPPKKHKKNPAAGVPRTEEASVARKPAATFSSVDFVSTYESLPCPTTLSTFGIDDAKTGVSIDERIDNLEELFLGGQGSALRLASFFLDGLAVLRELRNNAAEQEERVKAFQEFLDALK